MSRSYLRRYTDITALIYLLSERKITLLDPRSWDDGNDSYYLKLYRKKRKLKSVLALCFTETDERYHYWKVFGGGSSGVSIRFDRARLLKAVRKEPGLQMNSVDYERLADIRKRILRTEELPYLKRFAFEHESEFRMIYESNKKEISKLDIAIPLSSIDKITLNPWIHPDLFEHVRATLHSIDGCSALGIVRSTLLGNEEWKRLGDAAT